MHCINCIIHSHKYLLFPATVSDLTHGYISFKTEKETIEAYKKCRNQIIPTSNPPARFQLNHVLVSNSSVDIPDEYSIYVGDLPADFDDMKLFKLFADKYPSLRTAKGERESLFMMIHRNQYEVFIYYGKYISMRQLFHLTLE